MYDPTIFENLKVAFENHVYDLDNIDHPNEIWEDEIELTQTLSYVYKEEASDYLDTIEIEFISKINEDNMGEIADFLDHVLETLEALHRI
ncbi:hypothetical protein [Psychrobacillus sp. NPDC093180]|uniref:hypothetical protein n=1 Tax=Psychrobacillus sp. NPDC093180 TaxID=3364489 RepID=UPI0037FFCF3E